MFLETVHEINTILENGEVVDLIYLDFQRAFDKVPHERLLLKLKAYGITGQCTSNPCHLEPATIRSPIFTKYQRP